MGFDGNKFRRPGLNPAGCINWYKLIHNDRSDDKCGGAVPGYAKQDLIFMVLQAMTTTTATEILGAL